MGTHSFPYEIISNVQRRRPVIQDTCPLAASIEWALGQQYFVERGNKAFIGDARPVPYAVNNDGALSARTAELFFESLGETDLHCSVDSSIFALEAGVGVGLFARFFLDRFRDLCHRNNKNYYERLIYLVVDRSEKMLADICRHGIFADHAGHYRLGVVDANDSEKALDSIRSMMAPYGGQLQAIFLNYLLDCLPAAVLRVEGDEFRQLCVRTYLARGSVQPIVSGVPRRPFGRLTLAPRHSGYNPLH